MNGIILGKMNLAELSSTITSIQPNSDVCATIPPGGGCSTPLNAYNQTRMSAGIYCYILLHAVYMLV